MSIVETDLRVVSHQTLRRLCLEAGVWPPVSLPISRAEVFQLLSEAERRGASAFEDTREAATLRWVLESNAGSTSTRDTRTARDWRVGGRALLLASRFGHLETGQSGLEVPAGGTLVLEPLVEFGRGRLWGAAGCRLAGPVFRSERGPEPLTFAGWPRASGMETLGAIRRSDGEWGLDWPNVACGIRLGNWALSAGRQPRRLAPGSGGGLVLDETGVAFSAVTLRRTAPFDWSGPVGPLAPDALLLRGGRLSEQTIFWHTDSGLQSRRQRPWLMQWLLTWNFTSWIRTTVTHSSLAVAREGSLWPDVLQVNFPGLGSTWNETERGPITDRILSLRMEGIFHDAPWPLLPAAAGRVYWEYAGEDIRPNDRISVLPEIAVPASVIGCELLGPRWDLQVEYAELEHPSVLWYANGGFEEGYSHDGWLLGHPLGGSGEAVTVETRWRPGNSKLQGGLLWGRETHGCVGQTPGESTRQWLRLEVRRDETRVPWRMYAEWGRQELRPWADTENFLREYVWRAGCCLGAGP